MGIGGGGGVDLFGGGILYHVQKVGVEVGLALEIKHQVS